MTEYVSIVSASPWLAALCLELRARHFDLAVGSESGFHQSANGGRQRRFNHGDRSQFRR